MQMLTASAVLFLAGHRVDAACRDTYKQPFNGDSIWNTPLGADARFVDAGLSSFATGQYHVDTNYVVPAGTQPVDVINQGWWGPTPEPARAECPMANASNTWCHCTIFGNVSGTQLNIPHDFVTDSDHAGNNGATIAYNTTHVVQMQPMYRCAPGSPILAEWQAGRLAPSTGPPDRYLMSLWGTGTYGAHGGSGLSSLGGQIRRGELNRSAPPISHALSVELFAHRWYFCSDFANRSTCFRWPAITADGYAVEAGNPMRYNGSNPNLQVGTLLAVPRDASARLGASLQTGVAKRVLDAMTSFGAYVVDDAAGGYLGPDGKTNINYEQGVSQEVLAEYGLILECGPDTQSGALFKDYTAIFQELRAVASNGPQSVGGGGAPIVAPPPKLCPPGSG